MGDVMINMITKIYQLYPNGIEKGRNIIGNNTSVDPKIKAQALEMDDRGVSQVLIAKKLGIDASTIAAWRKPAERY